MYKALETLIGFIAGMLMLSLVPDLNWADWYEINNPILVIGAMLVFNWPVIDYQSSAHAVKINKGVSPKHGLAALFRLLPTLGFAMIAHAHSWNLSLVLFLFGFNLSIWGMWFFTMLNKKTGKDKYYIDIDGNGSLLDEFLYKTYGARAGRMFYTFCIALSIVFSLLYFLKFPG